MSELKFEKIDPDKISEEKKKKLERTIGVTSGKVKENEVRLIAKNKEGKPVGYVDMVPEKSKKRMRVDNIFVNQEKRGEGIGSQMAKKIDEVAKELGVERIYGVSKEKESVKNFWKKKGNYKIEESGRIEKKINKKRSNRKR